MFEHRRLTGHENIVQTPGFYFGLCLDCLFQDIFHLQSSRHAVLRALQSLRDFLLHDSSEHVKFLAEIFMGRFNQFLLAPRSSSSGNQQQDDITTFLIESRLILQGNQIEIVLSLIQSLSQMGTASNFFTAIRLIRATIFDRIERETSLIDTLEAPSIDIMSHFCFPPEFFSLLVDGWLMIASQGETYSHQNSVNLIEVGDCLLLLLDDIHSRSIILQPQRLLCLISGTMSHLSNLSVIKFPHDSQGLNCKIVLIEIMCGLLQQSLNELVSTNGLISTLKSELFKCIEDTISIFSNFIETQAEENISVEADSQILHTNLDLLLPEIMNVAILIHSALRVICTPSEIHSTLSTSIFQTAQLKVISILTALSK